MESRFSRDLSAVRVHTGNDAAASARAVNALAYTVKNHVVFGAHQYQPSTTSGRRLLAHEMAHVIQQDGSGGISLQRFECKAGTLTDTRCSDAQGSGHPAGINLEKFDEEKSKLKPVHIGQIAAFKTSWVAAGSKDNVKVHGYASCDGASNMNVQLSCARAESVKTELGKQGVTSTITTEAHGETDEFGPKVEDNRRAIIETIATPKPKPKPDEPPPPPPPPATCPAVPGATPGTCLGRNGGYCSAESCHATNPWLKCVCGTSLQICQAIDAFSLTGVQGMQLETCIDTFVPVPTNMGVKIECGFKAKWFRDTNKCIWGHWKEALDALHDPSVPIPGTVTSDWRAAIGVCRSKGVASNECCKAQVEAEQKAIDICGKYDSSRFGNKPTDIPGSPECSAAAKFFAPKPAFVGDFGSVADRIAHGNKVCCP
jgi:outer membrane protein OmpA-like peptidoglycan-associated protein